MSRLRRTYAQREVVNTETPVTAPNLLVVQEVGVRMDLVLEDPALMVNVVANYHAHTEIVTGESAYMEVAFLGNVRMMTALVAIANIPPVTATPHATMDLAGECANMKIAFLGNVRMTTALVGFANI